MAKITNFLERIADLQSPFILYSGRVYGLSKKPAQDFLDISGTRLGLVPSLSFAEFEQLDELVQQQDIAAAMSEYVQESIQTQLNTDVSDQTRRIRVLQFIMTEFLPFYISKQYDGDSQIFDDILGIEDDALDPLLRAKEEIQEKLNQDFPQIQEDGGEVDVAEVLRHDILNKERLKLERDPVIEEIVSMSELGIDAETTPSSILGKLISNQALYVDADKNVHVLKPVAAVEKESNVFVFNLGGKQLAPSSGKSFSLDKLYSDLSEVQTVLRNISALEHSRDTFQEIKDQLKESSVSENFMRQLLNLSEYGINGSGFVVKDDEYYVYATVPKFATQDGRDPKVFWPYDSSRVAIRVGWDAGDIYTRSNPVVVEDVVCHPCLENRGREGGFHGICNLSRRAGSYNNTLLDMVRKLSDAVNAVTQPLNKPSLDAHSGGYYFGSHLNEILKQGSLTREEAIEQGYMVVEVIEREVKFE